MLLEPVVFLTNWMLSFQCFYYFIRLNRKHNTTKSFFYWKYFFFLFAISTFFGGLSHLFFHYWELWGKIPGWSAAICSITFLELAVLSHQEKNTQFWNGIVWFQLVLIFTLLIIDFRFIWVTVQTAVGLIFVLGIYSIHQLKKSNTVWKGYLIGIGWMIVSVPIAILKIDLAIWFNHQDISHVFMLLCLYCFYKTVLKVET